MALSTCALPRVGAIVMVSPESAHTPLSLGYLDMVIICAWLVLRAAAHLHLHIRRRASETLLDASKCVSRTMYVMWPRLILLLVASSFAASLVSSLPA